MSQKVVLICDPGIDGAFAVALALFDPSLEVLGLAATAGNVSAQQATKNVHILIEQLDPPRWPRLGAAPAVEYDVDGIQLHGPTGLGNVTFPCAPLHHANPSEKLIVDLVRAHPREVTIVCMGPATVLARALDLNPELPTLARKIILLGGTLHEPGNAGPVSEFHFFCDPLAARQVLRCGASVTLIPLDAMRKLILSPTDLLGFPTDSSRACQFLREIVPYGLAATCNMFGVEGFHLKDVLGTVAVAMPEVFRTRSMRVDVETRGELTRGMSVFDQRFWEQSSPNVEVALEVNITAVRGYLARILKLELP
jgi:inosine-uridine nucleoside N-ribohydrolase